MHVTRHQEVYDEDYALYVPCSRVQLARVAVRVLVLVDVVCVIVMLVLIARVDVVHAVDTVLVAIFVVIFCNWRCTLHISLTFATFGLCRPSAGRGLPNFDVVEGRSKKIL